jgi:dihydroorotate dehydrogenase (NAD+) catalytic subunit
MIDLAPNHKLGLLVPNPILLAGGMIGCGEARHSGLATAALGAVVIGPITLNNRSGSTGPRLAELNGGFVWATGLQNRGVNAVLKQFAALWPRLGCPVIAQVADEQPSALAKVAGRLTSAEGLGALELLLPRTAEVDLARTLVRTAERATDLPIWVKLPLERVLELAPAVVDVGAVGVVVGQPPLGAALPGYAAEASALLTGALYGPLTFAPMLAALAAVANLQLPAALIAAGGIHTRMQVQQALAVGAHAVQLDSAVWVEPGLPARLAAETWRLRE